MQGVMTSLQKALYTELTGDATLMALIRAVGDWPSPDTELPHVTIGEDRQEEWSDKFKGGWEVESMIHVWTSQVYNKGWKQAKEIADRIIFILFNNTLSLEASSNHFSIGRAKMPDKPRYMDDPEETIRRIILTFTFHLKET